MKPQTIIFSSSTAYPVAQSIKRHLESDFTLHLWREDFFGENRTTPLWTFFKKLFYYDCAIIILSDDNLIPDTREGSIGRWMPKDNVIFELGATMARLGPQKTIMLTPDEPQVSLPGYFDDVSPIIFTYRNDKQGDQKATFSAAESVREVLDQLGPESFHSELPAQGLAHAYLQNFLHPILRSTEPQILTINEQSNYWSPDMGISITVVIPGTIMGRRDANLFFEKQLECYPASLHVKDGRDMGFYALTRQEGGALHILDIPTTLLTSEKIVESIEHFWRSKDGSKVLRSDEQFIAELKQREILNFKRSLMINSIDETNALFIKEAAELSHHIHNLQNK